MWGGLSRKSFIPETPEAAAWAGNKIFNAVLSETTSVRLIPEADKFIRLSVDRRRQHVSSPWKCKDKAAECIE